MNNDQILQLMDDCLFREYEVAIENRESRFILKSADPVEGLGQPLIKAEKEANETGAGEKDTGQPK